jgi:hypothetical protein
MNLLIDFSEMVAWCIHQEGFTNALPIKERQRIIAEFLRGLRSYSGMSLGELEEREHCHLVTNPKLKRRIGKLLDWKKEKLTHFIKRDRVFQISFGKSGARLFGLMPRRYYEFYIFKALLFDPCHLIYQPSGKNVMLPAKDLTCLFNPDDCLELNKVKYE